MATWDDVSRRRVMCSRYGCSMSWESCLVRRGHVLYGKGCVGCDEGAERIKEAVRLGVMEELEREATRRHAKMCARQLALRKPTMTMVQRRQDRDAALLAATLGVSPGPWHLSTADDTGKRLCCCASSAGSRCASCAHDSRSPAQSAKASATTLKG